MSSCGPASGVGATAGKVGGIMAFRLLRFGRSSRALIGVGVGGRRAGTKEVGIDTGSAIRSPITRKGAVDSGVGEAGDAGSTAGYAATTACDGEVIGDAGEEADVGTARRCDPLKKPNPLPPFRGVTSV